MADRRVVISGLGAVTPLGCGVDRFWDRLIAGECGITAVTVFDATGFDSRIGAQCDDFDADQALGRRKVKRLDPFAQYALAAANEAWADSGLDIAREDPGRIAVIIGSGIGGLHELEEQHGRLMQKGPSKVSAFTIPRLMLNAASGTVSIELGLKGSSTAVSTACASATNAMGDALAAIRTGRADVVVTGGSEAAMTPLGMSSFASMKALSTRNDDPARASRPFDRDRDGFVLGEGAGVLIFEEFEHARSRGASMYAEVVGFGGSADASHITQPCADGAGAAAAMTAALKDAGLDPSQIDYVNAHGTSTPLGDVAETVAIRRVFGSHADKMAVSSTKGATGHLLGASGGVEVIACILGMKNGVAPPTINLDHPGEGCDLDYVPNRARDMQIRRCLNNSFGFGGHNACLILETLD